MRTQFLMSSQNLKLSFTDLYNFKMRLKMEIYEKPIISLSEICQEGFICASIKKLTFSSEVDEYYNAGTEEWSFDSND